jgi:hypothetical protein
VWGGTKDLDWSQDGHCVTFHFSSSDYRDFFVGKVTCLLPSNLWIEIKRNDNDPATPHPVVHQIRTLPIYALISFFTVQSDKIRCLFRQDIPILKGGVLIE